MRSTDPGFKRNREVSVQVGGLQARIQPENRDALLQRFSVLFEIHAGFKGTNYGYELDVRQAGGASPGCGSRGAASVPAAT